MNLRLSVPCVIHLNCTHKSVKRTAIEAYPCVWVWLWTTGIHQGSHIVDQPTFPEQQASDFQNAKDSGNRQPSLFAKRLSWGYYRSVFQRRMTLEWESSLGWPKLGSGSCEFGRFNPPPSWLCQFCKHYCTAKCSKISARLLMHSILVIVHRPDKWNGGKCQARQVARTCRMCYDSWHPSSAPCEYVVQAVVGFSAALD